MVRRPQIFFDSSAPSSKGSTGGDSGSFNIGNRVHWIATVVHSYGSVVDETLTVFI